MRSLSRLAGAKDNSRLACKGHTEWERKVRTHLKTAGNKHKTKQRTSAFLIRAIVQARAGPRLLLGNCTTNQSISVEQGKVQPHVHSDVCNRQGCQLILHKSMQRDAQQIVQHQTWQRTDAQQGVMLSQHHSEQQTVLAQGTCRASAYDGMHPLQQG